ncbi:MAG: DUF4175 family protein, partial [Pseudomonadota bacterium]
MTSSSPPSSPVQESAPGDLVEKLPLGRTRAILLWEQCYAIFTPMAAIILAFFSLSLWGVWDILPWWAHWASLLGTFLALVFYVNWRPGALSWPSRQEVLGRLEKDNNLAAGILLDQYDTPLDKDQTGPLWQKHISRLQTITKNSRPRPPKAAIDQTDPFSLRYAALLLFTTGAIYSGSNFQDRLGQSLQPGLGAPIPLIADIWVEPPAYTNRPTQFLARGENLPNRPFDNIAVPVGSELHVRLARQDGKENLRAHIKMTTDEQQIRLTPTYEEKGLTLRHALRENSAILISAGGRKTIWPFQIIPDTLPSVRWATPIEEKDGNRISFSVELEDDYGVSGASLHLRLSPNLHRAPDIPSPSKSSWEKRVTIDLPLLRGALAAGQPTIRTVNLDLTEHPWAGLPLEAQVQITDGAGQTALTPHQKITLPTRRFYNSLAQTVIEERQNIALAPESWTRSTRLFDALTFAPDRFYDSTQQYILIRTAYHDLYQGAGENIEEIVDSFWPLAIALEDDGITFARQRLEAARRALKEALARNAPQDEIDQLVEELRLAKDAYIAALAASGDAYAEDNDNTDLQNQDLDTLLDEIADLRRQGRLEEAQDLLSQLAEMLENMRIANGSAEGPSSDDRQAQSGQQGSGGQNSGNADGEGTSGDGLNQAGELIDQQRRLADQTFSAQRGDRDIKGLADEQFDLAQIARDLSRQRETTEDTAADQNLSNAADRAQQAFAQAAERMENAGEALARGDLRRAQIQQDQVLEALNQGARALANQRLAEDTGGETAQGQEGQAQGTQGTANQQAANRDP